VRENLAALRARKVQVSHHNEIELTLWRFPFHYVGFDPGHGQLALSGQRSRYRKAYARKIDTSDSPSL
jgi:hypothetical protein